MQTYHLFLAETRSFFLAANLVLMEEKRESKHPKCLFGVATEIRRRQCLSSLDPKQIDPVDYRRTQLYETHLTHGHNFTETPPILRLKSVASSSELLRQQQCE